MDESNRSTARRHVRTALRANAAGDAPATREPLAADRTLGLGAPRSPRAPVLQRSMSVRVRCLRVPRRRLASAMPVHELTLGGDPEPALRSLRESSQRHPVLVFKLSPICPVSHRAEAELEAFLAGLDGVHQLALARIDVIAERALARGLTAALGVRHESPQALWFVGGELTWHGSHGALTRARFAELLSAG